MKLKVLATASILFAANSTFAHDNNCDMELNNTLTVTPQHVLIKKDDETVIDIYQDKMLFVRGDLVSLSSEQQEMVAEYSSSIRQAVPEVMDIAIDAVEIAFDGINAAFGDFADLSTTKEKFEEIKERIGDKYQADNGHYTFHDGEFNINVDDPEIDQAVEDIMEDVMPQVVGSLLSNLGEAISSGDSDFSKFDNMEERIEAEIDERSKAIEVKADAFCKKLKEMDKLEERLVASNDKLADLDLLNIKSH